MPKPDIPKFSLPVRIVFGVVALWLIWWLLSISGTI